MPQTPLPQTAIVTPANEKDDHGYAKITAIAASLGRHERTIREYIRLLHEEFGHPDFPEKLKGRSLSPRQQAIITKLSDYKTQGIPNSQICDYLTGDCSPRLTLNEACEWLQSKIPETLLTQFKEHFAL